MSEIINIGEAIIYSSFYVDNPKGVLSIQAASEVIKMINELNEYKEAARSEAEEVNRLQAENKKLREALEKIAYHVGKFPTYESYCELKDKAREALKEIKE